MKGIGAIMLTCAVLVSSMGLSGCGIAGSWNRSYNLRQWEKTRLAAERAFLEGDFARAEELFRSSVRFARDLGTSDFRLGATLALLGDAIRRQNKLDDARSVYEMASASINERLRQYSTETDRRLLQEDMASVQLSLGDICLASGDLKSAHRSYEKAAGLYKEWQGTSRSSVLAENYGRALLGLGTTEARLGNTGEAVQTYKGALESKGAGKYSHTLRKMLQGQYAAAIKGEAASADIQGAQLSDRFQDLMLAAREATHIKDFAAAQQSYLAAIELGTKQGLDDSKLSAAYGALGKTQEALHKGHEAEKSYTKALELNDKANPAGDEQTDFLLGKLAQLSHIRDDDKAAYGYLIRQLKLRKALNGDSSRQVSATLAQLSAISMALGRVSEARGYATQSWSSLKLSTRTKSDVLRALDTLATDFLGLGLGKEASAVNDRVIQIYSAKGRRVPRSVLAEMRSEAISALGGSSAKGDSSISPKLTLDEAEDRLTVIKAANEEVAFLITQGRLKSGAVMTEHVLVLFTESDLSNPDFRLAKIEALEHLLTMERKSGNKARAAVLVSEMDKLRRNRN